MPTNPVSRTRIASKVSKVSRTRIASKASKASKETSPVSQAKRANAIANRASKVDRLDSKALTTVAGIRIRIRDRMKTADRIEGPLRRPLFSGVIS